ncbi:hypothetical protein GQL87_24165, partial [Escherichia coli]|nr:hypothetical protein [Escherichia coli]
MLPSETMIWQPEFTDKTLSRKPGAVHPGEESQSSCRLPRGNRQTLLLGSMFAVRPATGSMDLRRTGK